LLGSKNIKLKNSANSIIAKYKLNGKINVTVNRSRFLNRTALREILTTLENVLSLDDEQSYHHQRTCHGS